MFLIAMPSGYLKLQFHAADVLSGLHLCQLLDVGEEASCRHLRVPTGDGLQKGIVDEAVLVFRLHHVVPLGAHEGHMTIDVYSLLMLDAF